MESSDKPCRHEYVKIFQRKYKDYRRRMVSTRGYLPTGFSNKDFAFLNAGAYCFCTTCRKRLFPLRVETAKIDKTVLLIPNVQAVDPIDHTTSQVINVEELQVEPVDVSEIVDKEIKVNQAEEEEGEK